MQASRTANVLQSSGRTLKRWLAAGLRVLLEGISARAQAIAGDRRATTSARK